VVTSLLTFIAAYIIAEKVKLFLYFTNWGMHISNISIILTILATKENFKSNYIFREVAGYLTELALIS